MRFIETHIFTRRIVELMDDESYRAIQLALLVRPNGGKTIRNSGGLRKFRCALQGRGKRGGARIIYYFDEDSETFYMLYAYAKNAQEDLTPEQVRVLARLVAEEFHEEKGL